MGDRWEGQAKAGDGEGSVLIQIIKSRLPGAKLLIACKHKSTIDLPVVHL